MQSRNPCRSARPASPTDPLEDPFHDVAGAPTHGIWAALAPASSHMSTVRSLHCFRELHHERSSCSCNGDLPLAPSPAASSPIQAAPGYRYHQYRMHEAEGATDQRFDNMRHGKSAPISEWRSCRKLREEKGRKACRRRHEEEDREEIDDADAIARGGCRNGEGDEEEEEEEERLPPHELVAREWAAATSCGGAAFSLCQGVGRTLKGRDLCRVRNAILKQTGFI